MRVFLFSALLLSLSLCAQAQNTKIDLIPKPTKITYAEGTYTVPDMVNLYVAEPFAEIASLLSEYPKLNTLLPEVIKKTGKKHNHGIRLFMAEPADKIAADAYRLTVDASGILLKANNEKAMLSGVYTLIQIGLLNEHPLLLPQLSIDDSPRFPYRGLHLDVSRHYMPFSFLKKYIDIMAIYKFNYFHWHLTDGAGWRLEIKKYPELTQKAAWRTHSSWKEWMANGGQYSEKGRANAYGGYYTQDQARELVAYAARKGITVIPEIEMPGHSEEVLATYPELSCTGRPYTQNEFCLGNEGTYTFMKNVLDEVLEIFPSEYIHIGGDEAEKHHWAKCPKCQALKAKEELKSEEELQSYAIKQMDEYLQSKGRKLVGWDEILEGGLTKGATVMSWRGEAGGIKAAEMGQDVIMTPNSHLYLDYYQADPRHEPEANDGIIPIQKVYAYNPVPSELSADKAKHIIGAQANIWTEFIPTYQQVEYMVFPRALALAEVNWTKQEQRSWEDFQQRLQAHYTLLQNWEVNYYRPSYHVNMNVTFDIDKKRNSVTLSSEQLSPVIYYTTDGTEPTSKSTPFKTPIELTASTLVKAASFIDSFRVSPIKERQLDIHKAIGKKVQYNIPWEGYPAQQELTLTNGVKGGVSYHDQQWQGFTKGMDVIIDFERREEIKEVSVRFMLSPGPGVHYPGEVQVLLSDNGKNYRQVGTITTGEHNKNIKLAFKEYKIKLEKPQMAKYIKVIATNPMKGYLFADEIVVY